MRIAFLLMLLPLLSCQQGPRDYDVEYQALGKLVPIDIKIVGEEQDNEYYYDIDGFWSQTCQMISGDEVYIRGKHNSEIYLIVTVAIYVDGSLYDSDAGSGPYAVATASGTLE